MLTNKEFYDRAKDAFQPLSGEYKLHILPVTWTGPEIENISASWVLSKMAKHGLKQKDLVEKLNVDKHVINKLLSGDFAFTRWHKAAFYYLFKSLESDQ
ncbi:MAG TPA: hypothetical protein VEA37_02715 [Flavobacterium sp.]|nr:hypothetical protein [Flavobacterium sp.]